MNGGFTCYVDMFEFELFEMWKASEDTRRDWFEWWLADRRFECLSCEAEFTPNVAALAEGDEILCQACATARSGTGTRQGSR